jgi:hypothetical protein
VNKQEAHEVLDKVRNGIWQPDKQITHALLITGDLQPNRFTDHDFGNESVYCRSRTMETQTAHARQFRSVYEHKPRCEGED